MGGTSSSVQVSEADLEKEKRQVQAHTVVPSKAVGKAPDVEKLLDTASSALSSSTSDSGGSNDDYAEFTRFRDELLSFSLGESAFDYSERLYAAQPKNPHVMALLAETATMYDEVKTKDKKGHWVDRMDLLQRAIDVSRKCYKENPTYGPCYRTYVVAASRASENMYYYRWMKGLGITENYYPIMKRGQRSVELMPQDPTVPNILGAVNARCSQWNFVPYRFYNWYYRVPNNKSLLSKAIEYHKKAVDLDPGSLEYMLRLGEAYYQAGDWSHARKCFYAVRDEMVPRSLTDSRWQSSAHTLLAAGMEKNKKWNVPFG